MTHPFSNASTSELMSWISCVWFRRHPNFWGASRNRVGSWRKSSPKYHLLTLIRCFFNVYGTERKVKVTEIYCIRELKCSKLVLRSVSSSKITAIILHLPPRAAPGTCSGINSAHETIHTEAFDKYCTRLWKNNPTDWMSIQFWQTFLTVED